MLYFLTVNYYSTELIQKLLDSIDGDRSNYQFVIVNNSPDDRTIKNLKHQSVVVLESETNLGFANACNLGLNWIYQENAQALVWIINPDTYLKPNSLESVFAFFKTYPKLSLVGTLIYTPTDDIWFAGGRFIPYIGAIFSTNFLGSNPPFPYVSCDWVSGCSLLINLCHFQSCPQFDADYFLYYEDFDFCRRCASQGHQIVITNRLAIIHQPSSITNRNIRVKLKHSTYSYLLTLERYTNPLVFWVRFLRLFFYTLILLPIKTQASLGKLTGITDYLTRNSVAQKS
ncbi:glycosyltransferase family 2 protein [Merismopedia glauca]|uniref:Glycosyl transferase n=1 Tax=Merismopedia glauca CCAP 1448/3 TaxID=1296344 RepID=A0A2T1C7D7_9CYAN|nr:glycosyltransferase family 2 protein [Merismopedia glauca]PSB04144.1 glycosyl transferase [Merismopedia glauca CCAP 1448/3]